MRLTATGPNNEMSMLQRFFFGIIRTFWLGILGRVRATEAPNEVTVTGIIPLNYEVHYFDTTAGAIASQLPDGTEGQHMTFVMTVDGGTDAVVTPDNLGPYLAGAVTTITFNDAGDTAELVFTDGAWYVKGTATATVA